MPEKCVPNSFFNDLFPERDIDGWLVKNVGIKERHMMADDQATSDLCMVAANQALARAGIQATDLGLVIVATDTPDYFSPATSTVLQHKIGAVNSGTFDMNCACAGWVTAVETAARYMMTDNSLDYALVVGAYGMSRFIDYTDHKTCTLFADGAGAVVIGSSPSPGFIAGKRITEGSYYDALGIYTGAVACMETPTTVNDGRPRVQFVRRFPATFNSENWPALIKDTVKEAGLTPDEIDFYLFTQLNVNTIKMIMEILEQPLQKTHWIMDKWGYTGSACIPMALDDAINERQLPQPGDMVLFCASGGGISMACNIWKWQ